jgi:nucleotide-binding universal stress UspA family protein
MKKVLIAIDGSPNSKNTLLEGASLAKKNKAKITLVTVAQTSFEADLNENEIKLLKDAVILKARVLLEETASALKRLKIKADAVLREGDPADEILLVANEIKPDIIVVGSKGKGKIARFLLGSVSRKIAELAKCSVFVVK